MPKEIVGGVIGGFVLWFVFFYYGNNKQEKSLSKDNVDNTIKRLDKLNMLKQSGAINDNDYDAMKKGLLSENNHKSNSDSDWYILIVIVLIILGGIFFIYNPNFHTSSSSSQENTPKYGKQGFTLKLNCFYGRARLGLFQCVQGNFIELTTDKGRQVYSGFNTSGYFNVPQHFTFKAVNQSDKFVLTLSVIDNETNQEVWSDQAGQYSVVEASY